LVHLCNNVSLIAPPNCYFQKPAIVEILITNLRGLLFIGTPSTVNSKPVFGHAGKEQSREVVRTCRLDSLLAEDQ